MRVSVEGTGFFLFFYVVIQSVTIYCASINALIVWIGYQGLLQLLERPATKQLIFCLSVSAGKAL